MSEAKNELKTMRLSDLNPAPYNPRKISKEAMAGLISSIKRFGMVQPIIFNKRSGFVVAGHQRLKALEKLGAKETEVLVVDLLSTEEKAMNVTLNNPEIEGIYTDGLEDILKEIHLDFTDIEFADLNLDKIIKNLDFSPVDISEQPRLDKKLPITCPKCGHEFTS
jgi:ParB-like chromosome segregation protein Spo0J